MSYMRMATMASSKEYSWSTSLPIPHEPRQRGLLRTNFWGYDALSERRLPCKRNQKSFKGSQSCAVNLKWGKSCTQVCSTSTERSSRSMLAVEERIGTVDGFLDPPGSIKSSVKSQGRRPTLTDPSSNRPTFSSGTGVALLSLIGLGLMCMPAAGAAITEGWTGSAVADENQAPANLNLQEDFELVLDRQVAVELQAELALHSVLAPPLVADTDDAVACPSCGISSGVLVAAKGLESASVTITALGPVAAASTTAATTAVAALSVPAVAARVSMGTANVAAAASSSMSTLQPPVAAMGMASPGVLGPLATALASAAQHFGGGSIAGAVGATVVFPLDTVKTKMQAQKENDGEEPEYKDAFDCFCQLVTKEGPASLYSGLVPQLIGIAPEKALKLTVNEMLLAVLQAQLPGSQIWALELLAGAGGGGSQVVFTNPVEIVKVRLQTQSEAGVKPKTAMEVVRELGLSGLYNGTLVTLARDVPSSSLFFGSYALLKPMFPGNTFFAGALAAAPATLLVTPMDVIKTRMQMELRPGQEPYKDAWDCMWRITREEGVGALFKGGLTRVLRVSPQFGITLMVYDLLC